MNETGGTVVVQTLRRLGINAVFGVPGGQTLAITDAILEDPQVRFVTARHEGAAACMADAVGRLTRTPGVCLATTGPGATNMLTGIGGAFRDSSPVIAITCNNRLRDLDRDDAQAADHVAIFRPLVKWAKLVSNIDSIEQAIEEAYLRATSGCPGPVLLDFPRDVLESTDVKFTRDRARPERVRQGFHADRPEPDRDRVAAALDMLRTAQRPTLWIGNGVKFSGAGAASIDLAQALHAPIVTTFNGIGAVPTEHELSFGVLSRMGTELSSRVLSETDVLIVAGNSLNAVSTRRWSMDLPERIIQIDLDPTVIGRYYAERTLGICSDVGTGLGALTRGLTVDPGPEGAITSRQERLQRLSAKRKDWWSSVMSASKAPDGTVAPLAAITAIRTMVPRETIAIFDAGNPGVWSYGWRILEADTYLKPVGFGNMGFALPAIVGARVAKPEAPLIAFIGDGSLGMSLGELETLARENIKAIIIVMNDSAYGNIRQEQILHYGADRTIGVDFHEVDYATIARGCGIVAKTARNLDELRGAVDGALDHIGPFVIDLRIDGSQSAWTYGPFQPFTELH